MSLNNTRCNSSLAGSCLRLAILNTELPLAVEYFKKICFIFFRADIFAALFKERKNYRSKSLSILLEK